MGGKSDDTILQGRGTRGARGHTDQLESVFVEMVDELLGQSLLPPALLDHLEVGVVCLWRQPVPPDPLDLVPWHNIGGVGGRLTSCRSPC